MGYTTEFQGAFQVEPALEQSHVKYLQAFANSRRMKRDKSICRKMPDPIREAVGLAVGPEGCYFVGGQGFKGQERDKSVVEGNQPPAGQPGLWCKWEPTDDGNQIEWNGAEKFYDYIEWIEYLIKHFLVPGGYVLNGDVMWQGEEIGDVGMIQIVDNIVDIKRMSWQY